MGFGAVTHRFLRYCMRWAECWTLPAAWLDPQSRLGYINDCSLLFANGLQDNRIATMASTQSLSCYPRQLHGHFWGPRLLEKLHGASCPASSFQPEGSLSFCTVCTKVLSSFNTQHLLPTDRQKVLILPYCTVTISRHPGWAASVWTLKMRPRTIRLAR